MKIVKLSKEANNGKMRTPIDSLEEAIEDFKNGELKGYNKILIIPLKASNEIYDVTFIQAGMTMSECIALIEIAKTTFLKEMGYI